MEPVGAIYIDNVGYGESVPVEPWNEGVDGAQLANAVFADYGDTKWKLTILRVRRIPTKHPDSKNGKYVNVVEIEIDKPRPGCRAIYGQTATGEFHCFMN